jgi:hypothetical protein
MKTLRRYANPISQILVVCLLSFGVPVPAALAGIIDTATAVRAGQAQQQREHVRGLLDREDVRAALIARGVNPAVVRSRVNSLTDAEVDTLATRLDKLPSGGGLLEIAFIAFIILVITDALGYTDIFPFIKSKKK